MNGSWKNTCTISQTEQFSRSHKSLYCYKTPTEKLGTVHVKTLQNQFSKKISLQYFIGMTWNEHRVITIYQENGLREKVTNKNVWLNGFEFYDVPI